MGCEVAWEIFEPAASRYESWYTTPRGNRVDHAERALLTWLLGFVPQTKTVLEVGCGTGHFTRWLTSQGLFTVGLDRAPAMVAEAHTAEPTLPVSIGDAHALPVRDHAVDVAMLVTTLEFLEQPTIALTEAVRVARHGLILLVLNRWSFGGCSRRWGQQASGTLLGNAHDYSLRSLRALVHHACGPRLDTIHWASTLFPNGLWSWQARVPVGDVLGLIAVLQV
jgi:ubiquinone/menaquinone biosynthesis C-methylase UbiE